MTLVIEKCDICGLINSVDEDDVCLDFESCLYRWSIQKRHKYSLNPQDANGIFWGENLPIITNYCCRGRPDGTCPACQRRKKTIQRFDILG
jgi:rubrerythrin